jgi:hypothetical protein
MNALCQNSKLGIKRAYNNTCMFWPRFMQADEMLAVKCHQYAPFGHGESQHPLVRYGLPCLTAFTGLIHYAPTGAAPQQQVREGFHWHTSAPYITLSHSR